MNLPLITKMTIIHIEKIFGFKLYDWQKDYLLGNYFQISHGRATGKTFIYCVKILLTNGKPIKKRELSKFVDEHHGSKHTHLFCDYVQEINKKLTESGFQTRIIE